MARRRGPLDPRFRGDDKCLAIYIHWPYCVSKCPYCDFNSQKSGNVDFAEWSQAYVRELDHYATLLPDRVVSSVYFGGGTPSLMSSSIVEGVLKRINACWHLTDDVEITLEANPSSAEADKFALFRAAGVNRLSLGVQSLRDEALQFLGRAHDVAEARRALELAAAIFPRWSFDLIYARAGQTPEAWEEELREALAFGAKQMSLYQLTIEEGTQFAKLATQQRLAASEDDAAAMYETTLEIMKAAGLPMYEISNYARSGEKSRHNLTYWRYGDYIGVGPGAHGRYVLNGVRHAVENHRKPDAWLKQVATQGQGQKTDEVLDGDTAQREALMMGLRLVEGIDACAWKKKFGCRLEAFLSEAKLEKLRSEGFCVFDRGFLRATKEGLQRLDSVLGYLLS